MYSLVLLMTLSTSADVPAGILPSSPCGCSAPAPAPIPAPPVVAAPVVTGEVIYESSPEKPFGGFFHRLLRGLHKHHDEVYAAPVIVTTPPPTVQPAPRLTPEPIALPKGPKDGEKKAPEKGEPE